MDTVQQAVIENLRAELAQFIRDELDLAQSPEENLPLANRAWLNGARRLVERVEKRAGVEHVYVTVAYGASPAGVR